MEVMQEAMIDGRDDDGDHRQESESTIKRVKGGEEFGRGGRHGIDRAHAGENHRRVQESIVPGELAKIAIARGPHDEADCDDHQRHQEAPQQSPCE